MLRLARFPLRRFVLKAFAADGRDLTDKETKAFLQAADKDGDGKIGAEGKMKGLKRNTKESHTYFGGGTSESPDSFDRR